MDTKQISVKISSAGLATTFLAGALTAVEQPHLEISPPQIIATLSNPYTASGGMIEDSWEGTIEGRQGTLVRRSARVHCEFSIVTLKLRGSASLSLPVFHTGRDAIEAIFSEHLARPTHI